MRPLREVGGEVYSGVLTCGRAGIVKVAGKAQSAKADSAKAEFAAGSLRAAAL